MTVADIGCASSSKLALNPLFFNDNFLYAQAKRPTFSLPKEVPMILHEFTDSTERSHVRDLVAEANHRIANSLGLLSGLVKRQVSELDARRHYSHSHVRQILDDMRSRVETVARFHRMLSAPAGEGPVEVGGYVHQLASSLVSSLSSPEAVTLHFMCELGCRLDRARALHLGLIVCELVTNSIKYAHPTGVHGHIQIWCRRTPQGLMIEISDDGVGLPEGFDIDRDGGTGLELMRSLARQIGATLAFEDGGLGFRCAIHVSPFAPA
jgi:two-component sensor histidine kinase